MLNVESPNARSQNADSHYAPLPKTGSHFIDSPKPILIMPIGWKLIRLMPISRIPIRRYA